MGRILDGPGQTGGDVKPSAKWKAFALVAFFFGFPFFGMLYVWNDLHSKLRHEASLYIAEVAPIVFTRWDGKAMDDYWNVNAEGKPDASQWSAWKKEYGDATGPLGQAEPYSSYTSERNDMMWQVVKVRFLVPGSVKGALVDLQIARLSEGGPRWHVERVAVKDAQK